MLQEWLMVFIKLKLSAFAEEVVKETKGAVRILLLMLTPWSPDLSCTPELRNK